MVSREAPERAWLVAVESEDSNIWQAQSSIDELARLAESAGAEVVGRLTQRLKSPHKTHYLGKGKIEELASLKSSQNFQVAIFDDELTPLQQLNLEKVLRVKVIDRAALILDIFAKRAKTREGQLQVELAQLQYILPRLAGQWSHLERLGAGIGTKGPGESQMETDRRLIRHRIQILKKRIEEIRRHRELYRSRRHRSGLPIVSLVGYTNAGKSALFNTITRADVLTRDKLFSTLDPTTRRMRLDGGGMALLTDTVGFIQKLPPTIVTAFRATLEELSEASLLIHVVDLTSPNAAEQCQTVEGILRELEVSEKPRLTALNKIDLLPDKKSHWDETRVMDYLASHIEPGDDDTIFISAVKGWGLGKLRERITTILKARDVAIPAPAGQDFSLPIS
ncbi:MAG: GTPase HflX [Chloroflexota bacterium]